MQTYYYELENGSGQFNANSNSDAIAKVMWRKTLISLYKEVGNEKEYLIQNTKSPDFCKAAHLLTSAAKYFHFHVNVEEADIDGFDVVQWLDDVKPIIGEDYLNGGT